jgi:MGT family glycosyltransferase
VPSGAENGPLHGLKEVDMTAQSQPVPRRFLFVEWEGGGNLPPALGLARRLVARGHEVRVLSEPCNEAEVLAAGCAFIPYRRAPHRADKSPASAFARDWEAGNPIAAFALLREKLLFGPARAYAEDTLAELARRPADALVVSEGLFGGLLAAEKARVPAALLIPSFYPLPAPGLPPSTGATPARGPFGRVSETVQWAVLKRLYARGLPALNAARADFGLASLRHPFDQIARAERVLVLTSRAFDFSATSLPPNVRYVGPVLDDPSWAGDWDTPWPDDHPDPLVVVSLSSTPQGQDDLLHRTIAALGNLPVRGLVTTGPALAPADFPAPPNIAVRAAAPHARIFPLAAAVVTHAGHGTVIRALACGVPLVCLPMGRDQDGNAARVVARGAGLRLPPNAPADAIRAAVRRVLDDPGFRTGAQRLATAIAADTSHAVAIDELEQLATRYENHLPQPALISAS